jgi:hypothetical protein
MPKQIVYVHGAGPQKPAATLKHDIDTALFGKDMSTTRLAFYANVRWPTGGTPAGPAVAAVRGSSRARRSKAIRTASDPTLSPADAANEIVDATLRRRPVGGGIAPASVPDRAAARSLVRQLYRRADRVASRSSMPRRPAGGRATPMGITFPDPIFRLVVGRFASDVIDYLYGPFKQAMRAPVLAALRQTPRPKLIVAHSLGTIITYDALNDPALGNLSDTLLVTVGCPLGIGNVQQRLRDGAGRPNPVPSALNAWRNFADRWDPVALDQTLRDEFDPPPDFAIDAQVNNPAPDNHELLGYLSVAIVHDVIVTAAA